MPPFTSWQDELEIFAVNIKGSELLLEPQASKQKTNEGREAKAKGIEDSHGNSDDFEVVLEVFIWSVLVDNQIVDCSQHKYHSGE